jgi:Flp pilus assembly protein TadD
LDPNDGDTHNNLGVALERNGDLRAALEEYRKACTLDPKDATYESNFRRLSQQVDK